MKKNKTHNLEPESGNVFLFILLGVVLFAALSFTISRGFHSNTTSAISARQADLIATDIIAYASRIERAVNRARQKGCSETQINFDNEVITGYPNSNAPSNGKCDIFSPNGSVNFWDTNKANIHKAQAGTFYQKQYISGNVMHHPDAGAADKIDLTFWIADIDKKVCMAINKKIGITNPSNNAPDGTAKMLGGVKFKGTFSSTTPIARAIVSAGGELENQMSGCLLIETDSNVEIYAFYSVLLAR